MLKTRSDSERRKKKEQRVFNDPNYKGPERRSGSDKRNVADRRYQNRLQTALSLVDQEPAFEASAKEKAGRGLVGSNREPSKSTRPEGGKEVPA